MHMSALSSATEMAAQQASTLARIAAMQRARHWHMAGGVSEA